MLSAFSHHSVSVTDLPIIDCYTTQVIGKHCRGWYCTGKLDFVLLMHYCLMLCFFFGQPLVLNVIFSFNDMQEFKSIGTYFTKLD